MRMWCESGGRWGEKAPNIGRIIVMGGGAERKLFRKALKLAKHREEGPMMRKWCEVVRKGVRRRADHSYGWGSGAKVFPQGAKIGPT